MGEKSNSFNSIQYCCRTWQETIADYVRCLCIAYGSTCELETHILLVKDLGYEIDEVQKILIEKIKKGEKMLMALIKSLETKNKP